MTLQEIQNKIRNGEGDAIELLTAYISANPQDDTALTMRGMKYWGKGDRASAINDYLAALRINPESSAKEALKMTNEILDFYNKDLFNP